MNMQAITSRALLERACLKRVLTTLCTSAGLSNLPWLLETLPTPEAQRSMCSSATSSGKHAMTQRKCLVGMGSLVGGEPEMSHSTLSTQIPGHRWQCTLADSQPAATAASAGSMVMSPGSQVVINLSGSSRHVQILVNDDPEALSWEEADSLSVESVSPDRVHVQLRQQGAAAASLAGDGPLVLRVPPRFCSVDVTSGGGNVHVQAVKEGSLTVESRGGDIHIGSMAGATAELLSGGGIVTGSVTAEKVFVHSDPGTGSGSGDVRLDKLLAKEAVILARDLDTGSPLAVQPPDGVIWGGVHVTALYAEEAHIKSGGSPVSVGTMSCSGDAVILSGGGPVTVAGVDGCLRVISGGGAVELQLQRNVQEVHVNSNLDAGPGGAASPGGSREAVGSLGAGGKISCRIDPDVAAVLATCCRDLQVDIGLPFEALSVKGHVITARISPEPAQQLPQQQAAGSADDTPAAPAKHVVLDAGEQGRIEVSARSWADSIRDRFENADSGGGGGRKSMAQARAVAWVPPG